MHAIIQLKRVGRHFRLFRCRFQTLLFCELNNRIDRVRRWYGVDAFDIRLLAGVARSQSLALQGRCKVRARLAGLLNRKMETGKDG